MSQTSLQQATRAQELATLDRTARALDLAKTVDEIKMIRDKAEAVRKYAKSAALGLDAQNRAAEVKLRAERKAGQLLELLELRGGDRKSNNHDDCLKLDDLGISQNQSTRWQREAQLNDDVFEEYLRRKRAEGGEIVAADVLRLVKLQSNKRASANGNTRAARANAKRSSPPGKRTRENPVSQAPLQNFVLQELKNHCQLLDDILRPIYSGTSSKLRSGECRGLGHLMMEIQALLTQLEGNKKIEPQTND